MYPIGTLKLTWINSNDYTVLDSMMFKPEELDKALNEADKKKDWMIFQLTWNKDDAYSWKLLPYGTADEFVRSMKIKDSLLIPYLAIAGAGLFIYLILDKISRNGSGK
jgi:hypothetical protein